MGLVLRSDVLPSRWAEERRVLGGGESRFKGRFSYSLTPYAREIVDCWYPGNPAREVWVMKGAQVGISKGVIENGINYAMSEHPGNILYLIGNSELLPTTVRNLDMAIDGCGNRHLIRSQSMRRKGQKTGDTDMSKEFPAGMLRLGSATKFRSHRQFDAMYGVYDDYEAAKLSSGDAGDTTELLLQRHAAYWNVRKVFFLSSPEVHGNSNIERGYLRGDQRRFFIECPRCTDRITLEWGWNVDTNVMLAHDVEPPKHWKPADGETTAGMYWETDAAGRVKRNSVGYVCQSCGNFFDDREKLDWLQHGFYRPTAAAKESGLVSFHISSLYAPPGMKGWLDYVEQYLKANPPGLPQDRERFKTFMNVGLGMTHREVAMSTEARGLMKHQRNYKPGTVPEEMSIRDGNGRVVLLTLAADLNGTIRGINGAVYDDARVDWELVAWTESGASYSVQHGSIGTFVPREGDAKHSTSRQRWSYVHGAKNSVWPVLKGLIEQEWKTDTGRKMTVGLSGVDCGHYTAYAYEFLDKMQPGTVVGLRGEKEGQALAVDRDVKWFKKGSERNDYYLLDVSRIKDRLADHMSLRWNPTQDEAQPGGFMNYPLGAEGLYSFDGYFEHYESEQRVVVPTTQGARVRWEKKNSAVQNHFWDCRVYNMGLREILVWMVGQRMKRKDFGWQDYAGAVAQVINQKK